MKCPNVSFCNEHGCQYGCADRSGDDLRAAIFCLKTLHSDFRVIGNVRAVTLIRLLESSIESKSVNGIFNETGDWEPMVSIPVSEYEELKEIQFMYEDLQK